MCYNINCRIEIKSRIDGFESTISTNGKVTKTPSQISFDYILDGDECSLNVNNGEVVQTRRGEQNIKLTFRKGEQTECFLENGGFFGAFPVFTDDLQCTMRDINKGNDAVRILTLSIIYTLGEQKTEVNFSAEYKIEGKQ